MSRLKNVKRSGFTLLEVMIVVAIVGIGAALAYPNMIDMVHEYRLRSVARGVFSDLQEIKLLAVNEHVRTAVFVDEGNDTYTLFRDDNPEDWNFDSGGGELIRTVDVKAEGLEITCTAVSDTMGFNSRGVPDKFGTITIKLSAIREKKVVLSIAGNIRVE
ncbi:prepilin-type N-terminal cleavage/methylation domain-containing protein [uncultured Desulfobacter sp.]|uniref:prepilin-type N-terminal cleavage/methylation domain-containing protein n=1 Tax=uncultured Desulfobacter sp. TaxID=240139 RepID=UPI002AA96105|nr:prepilin-type N-terminal cleavage/methylation domain-containing protein [uncultured Desulfobacter sp.]